MDHIQKALHEILADGPLAEGLAGWRAVELWPSIVGQQVSARTRALRFSEGRLYVEVESPAWRQELSFLRHSISEKLNRELGADIVTGIHFVLAGGGRRARGKG